MKKNPTEAVDVPAPVGFCLKIVYNYIFSTY